jgi:uncharacterized protein YceK
MKTVSVAFMLVALAGCSTVNTAIDAYLMTKYDPVEYDRITAIRAHATQYANDCDDMNSSKIHAGAIALETQEFEMYSEHIPRNSDNIKASQALNDIAQGLRKQYDTNNRVSVMFCKLKFTGIANSANLIQTTVGKRPR